MSGLRIYGASDDLVEIEGLVSEEIDCYNRRVAITVGWPEASPGELARGVVVEMAYGRSGLAVWSAAISQLDEGCPIPWPVMVSATADGYSVVVDVDCPPGTPVTWVTR